MFYKVNVNGQLFDVSVQDIDQTPVKPFVTQSLAQTVTSVLPPSAPTMSSLPEELIISHISGKIRSINVSVGEQVLTGKTLVVLETMQMRYEVVAPRNGIVKQILATKGEDVEVNRILIVLI